MEKLRIFKFTDTVDEKHAFVIAGHPEEATEHLQETTSIPFRLTGTKFLEDFPKIQEFFDRTGNPIYRNDILPF